MTRPSWLWLARWDVARFLIHLGLWVAPDGPARDDLLAVLWAFGNQVRRSAALGAEVHRHNARKGDR